MRSLKPDDAPWPVLSVAGLRKSYGPVTVLRHIDLTISAGEVLALLGPNGAGKTTLISIVAGLLRPDAGSVRVGGQDALAGAGSVRSLVGLAPQELGICPEVTARENLLFFAELAGLGRRVIAARIEQVSAALGLDELLDRRAAILSTGQKRRLHTAAAVLSEPPLLLLDEPTVGADVESRVALLDFVRELAAGGTAVCYCTHYLPEVEALSASVAIMEGGEIIARGPVADLVASESRAAIELTFEGPAPAGLMTSHGPGHRGAAVAEEVAVDGSVLRIATQDEPAEVIAAVLGRLGDTAARLRGVEVLQPSLESVYLSITGRRFAAVEELRREQADAVS